MKKRIRKKKYSRWVWFRWDYDLAFYAYCENCKFNHAFYKRIDPEVVGCLPDATKLYNYCPNCGKKMLKPKNNIKYELYDIEGNFIENKASYIF